MVLLFHARVVQGVAWHQVLVAILIPDIVSLADSVCAAQLKLEDLLCRCLVERIREPVVTVSKLLRLDQVLVVLRCPSGCT